jgi:hypothetical protein
VFVTNGQVEEFRGQSHYLITMLCVSLIKIINFLKGVVQTAVVCVRRKELQVSTIIFRKQIS